jgi:hypothetical protein
VRPEHEYGDDEDAPEAEAYDPQADRDHELIEVVNPAAIEKVRRLVAAREKKDELETALEKAKEDYAVLDSEVWDMLDNAAMNPPFKFVVDGEEIIFHNKVTTYGKILDYDKAYDWARRNKMDEALNEDRFVMARISEEVRERRDNGQSMPPGVGFSERRFVSITRQK